MSVESSLVENSFVTINQASSQPPKFKKRYASQGNRIIPRFGMK